MNVALILSGGTGTRIGLPIPKQYVEVNGKLILEYSLEVLLSHPDIDAVQIVAHKDWIDVISERTDQILQKRKIEKYFSFSEPGQTRQLSILNGLKDIRGYAHEGSIVLIHDAARPMLTSDMVSGYLKDVSGHDGLLPVLPMKDTVYLSTDGISVTSLLNRSQVYAGQAPEVFVLGKYLEANMRLLPDEIFKINGSTEPAIMAGMDIAMVQGTESNFKITTQSDLERFRGLMC